MVDVDTLYANRISVSDKCIFIILKFDTMIQYIFIVKNIDNLSYHDS